MNAVSRRFLLWQGVLLGAGRGMRNSADDENVHRFRTAEYEVLMTIFFYDRYSSSGFWFRERRSGQGFCLSADGRRDTACLPNFTGALAVVHYRLRPLSGVERPPTLRERVRTIDHDERLSERPPFESALEVRDGIASDIQAFGVQGAAPGPEEKAVGPWCLLRQDLYLGADRSPFLVVHWRHTLNEIRIVDIIPAEGTR